MKNKYQELTERLNFDDNTQLSEVINNIEDYIRQTFNEHSELKDLANLQYNDPAKGNDIGFRVVQDKFGGKVSPMYFGFNGSGEWDNYFKGFAILIKSLKEKLKEKYPDSGVYCKNIWIDSCDDVGTLVVGFWVGKEYDKFEDQDWQMHHNENDTSELPYYNKEIDNFEHFSENEILENFNNYVNNGVDIVDINNYSCGKYAIVSKRNGLREIYYVKERKLVDTSYEKVIDEFDSRWAAEDELDRCYNSLRKAVGFSVLINRLKSI